MRYYLRTQIYILGEYRPFSAFLELRTFTADAAGDAAGLSDVLEHDCGALRMDGARVDILKKVNQVSFADLQSEHGRAYEKIYSPCETSLDCSIAFILNTCCSKL